jgi:hypothetical protein
MLKNLVKMAVPNPGSVAVGSTITLGAAPTGYQTFLAAFGAAWLKGRSEGSAAARARATQAEVKAAGERADAEIRADREPDPVERLREDWSRK